jgi:hypothetical protein
VKRELDAGREADRVATQFSGSPAHLLSIRTWQALCLACSKMDDHPADLQEICDTTLLLLDGFHLPSLTVFLENFLVSFCRRFPRFVDEMLLTTLVRPSLRSAHIRTAQGAALVLVLQLAHFVHLNSLVQRLVRALLPLLCAVQHPVRARAVFACAEWAKSKDVMACLDEASSSCVQMVAKYLVDCADLGRKIVKSEDDWLLRYVAKEPSLKLLIFDIPTKGTEASLCFFFKFWLESSGDHLRIIYA